MRRTHSFFVTVKSNHELLVVKYGDRFQKMISYTGAMGRFFGRFDLRFNHYEENWDVTAQH